MLRRHVHVLSRAKGSLLNVASTLGGLGTAAFAVYVYWYELDFAEMAGQWLDNRYLASARIPGCNSAEAERALNQLFAERRGAAQTVTGLTNVRLRCFDRGQQQAYCSGRVQTPSGPQELSFRWHAERGTFHLTRVTELPC